MSRGAQEAKKHKHYGLYPITFNLYPIGMKILASNRQSRRDYELTDSLVAGIALTGAEVKSAKLGHISLKGSYVNLLSGELYLINAHISAYKFAKAEGFEETRSRKLLVHKRQLAELGAFKQSGLALFPLAVGLEHGLVKVKVGIGRGLKHFDKRERAKKREAARDIARIKRRMGA